MNPGPLFRLPVFALFPYMLSGVALGIAEGMIESSSIGTKIGKMTGARIAESRAPRSGFSEATAYARLARRPARQLRRALEPDFQWKDPGRENEGTLRLEGATRWSGRCARGRDVRPVGRRRPVRIRTAARAFRDAHAVKQHFSFNTDIAGTTHGRVALGLPSDNPTL